MLDDAVLCTAWDDFDLDGHTWLGVDGNDTPFSAEGHFPVLAGYDASGKELYVASTGDWDIYSYVPDGARSLTIADRNGELRVCNRFHVLALCYDPCSWIECTIPDGAKLQTGYMYWIGEEESIRRRYRTLQLGKNPLEFSWTKYELRYRERVGVPKEEYEENLEAAKDDQDSLLEGKRELLSGDRTEKEVDALDRFAGVNSIAQEDNKMEGDRALGTG